MYRRQLRMARGTAETKERSVRSQFVQRVGGLPMVTKAWDYATTTYSSLKGSSRLANYTLSTAERSLAFVAHQAEPVVRRFEKQIQAVDGLVCRGLSTLEQKAPIITKPPEELLPSALGAVKSIILGLLLWPLVLPRLFLWTARLPVDACRTAVNILLSITDKFRSYAYKTAEKAGGDRVAPQNIAFFYSIGLVITFFENMKGTIHWTRRIIVMGPRSLLPNLIGLLGCLKPEEQNGDIYSKEVVTASGDLVANHED